MLYFVKIQLFMDKMAKMLEKSAKGEIPSPAAYSTIYCSTEQMGLGYAIFNVESEEKLDDILLKLEPYSKVFEKAPIITLEQFQARMAAK